MSKRVAKLISDSGVCSRRMAEKLIKEGRVKINGKTISTPAINVEPIDMVEVDDVVINNTTPAVCLYIYYKPVGLITTSNDPQGRPTIFEQLKNLPRVISVGRLDICSEGLLLLTNNGMLARKLELPSTKLERIYKVRAYGDINKILKFINKKFPQKIVIENIIYNVKKIELLEAMANKNNNWFEVVLTEGKNREIRKIFSYFGLQVSRLIRIKYGPFVLGDLKPGEYKEESLENFKSFI